MKIVTAASAVGCIGALVGLTATGILESLPKWIATLIVVTELLVPYIVYRMLKRLEKKR